MSRSRESSIKVPPIPSLKIPLTPLQHLPAVGGQLGERDLSKVKYLEMATNGKQRILTGGRPTGELHLGHWVGSLKNRDLLQEEYDCFFLVADLHSLTTQYEHPEINSTLPQNPSHENFVSF